MKPHLLGLVLAAGVCCGSIYAEPLLKPTVTAVEAELMADMEARHLQPGKILYAKVTLDWNGLGCVLRKGAILEAEVVAVVPHTSASKESEVALAFSTGQCGNSAEQPLALNLAAISVPPVDDSALSMDMPSGQIGQSAPTATDPNAGQTIQGPTSGFRSLISSNAEIWSQMQHWFAPDGTLRAGTVKGIRGVKLSVGTGPRNSSVLSAKDRNVALDKHTLLLLVPGSVAVAHADERGADAGLNAGGARDQVQSLRKPVGLAGDEVDGARRRGAELRGVCVVVHGEALRVVPHGSRRGAVKVAHHLALAEVAGDIARS